MCEWGIKLLRKLACGYFVSLCLFVNNQAIADSPSLDRLSSLVSRGDLKAIEELEKLASTDKDAARTIGIHYYKGLGVKKDQQLAIKFLEKAAELGDTKSKKFISQLSPVTYKSQPTAWNAIQLPGFNKKGMGSSFAVNTQGTFITSLHVVEKCQAIVVNYNNNKAYGKIFAYSKPDDLAVIVVNQPTPDHLNMRTANTVRGERVSVGGFPLDGPFAFSDGLVSSFPDPSLIQISAEVSSGNSGGPVVDASGQVIGVISSVLSPGQYSDGVGKFSVGSNFNFAVNTPKLIGMLIGNSVPYTTSNASKSINTIELARMLEKSTARLDCY